jgi:hypothetical protein
VNRRLFLGTLFGAAAAQALPSQVWPFRKIFLPPRFAEVLPENAFTDLNSYVFYLNPEQAKAMSDVMSEVYLVPIPPVPHAGTWAGLSRSPYPGKLAMECTGVDWERKEIIWSPKVRTHRELFSK